MIKGKVVLVPFPFDDLSTLKVRPAICLTDPVGPHKHVVLSFITSQIVTNKLESDVIIDSTIDDFNLTGLHVSSTIRLHRLITISASIIKRELGVISKKLQKEIDEKLVILFKLKL